MTAPTVVAFDLSLTSTGIADRNGTRRIRPKSTGPARLAEIRDAVLTATHVTHPLGSGPKCLNCGLSRYGAHPDLVVIEGYSYASANQAHQIGEMAGVVKTALYEAGIRYELVSPSSIKMYSTGNGGAKKTAVTLAASRRLSYEGDSDDEADALWLYALAMHALGAPIVDVPKSHLRALKALPWATTGVAA